MERWRLALVRPLLVGVMSTSFLLAGCQSATGPAQSERPVTLAVATPEETTVRSDAIPASNVQRPYINPTYRNNSDDDQTNPVIGFFAAAGAGVAAALWAIVSVPVNGLKYLSGDKPTQAVRMMEDASSADNRRAGINKLLEYDFTKREPYTKRYRQIAQYDTDPTVRATAIRALNRARDAKATKIFIAALSDKNDWVRLEGAKALVNVPDTAAADALLKLAQDPQENRDVRIAATNALEHDRTLPVARALAGLLADRDFGVSWQARESLRYLFNKRFGFDQAAWLAYFSGPESPVK